MKKIIYGMIGLILCNVANAANPVINSYDSTMYREIEPLYAGAGQLTGVSDTYLTYNIESKELVVKQTEWLGDGAGGEYPAPYESVFHYTDIELADFEEGASLAMFLEYAPTRQDFMAQAATYYSDILANTTDPAVLSSIPNSLRASMMPKINGFIKNSLFYNANPTFAKQAQHLWSVNLNQLDTRMSEQKHHDLSMWAGANYSSVNGDSFDADMAGIMVGMDKWVSDAVLLGVGYSFNDGTTDIQNVKEINNTTHNVYLYGEYALNKLYMNWVVNYGMADYINQGAYNLGAMVKAGYDMSHGVKMELGLRYINISSDDYTDSQNNKISYDTNNVLTLASGVKYVADITHIC